MPTADITCRKVFVSYYDTEQKLLRRLYLCLKKDERPTEIYRKRNTRESSRENKMKDLQAHVSANFVSSRSANFLGEGRKNLSAKSRKHPSQMFVPRTNMSEDNHVKCESRNCTAIVVSLHIAVVTNL
jgi:hypothetical protein